jgi:hypothetical protein
MAVKHELEYDLALDELGSRWFTEAVDDMFTRFEELLTKHLSFARAYPE